MENLITYKIQEDLNGKLKTAAKAACNFWNEFVTPSGPIVIRIGYYYSLSGSVAKAWTPWDKDGTTYGRVEFNKRRLRRFSDRQTTTSLIHEIGHVLGFGFDAWNQLFNKRSGRFLNSAIARFPALEEMRVELDYGGGTRYSHWDERRFDGEIMTGFKDAVEHVLPITIDIMTAFGHSVKRTLSVKTSIDELLDELGSREFTRHADVETLDLDYLDFTEVDEEIIDDTDPFPDIHFPGEREEPSSEAPSATDAAVAVQGSLAIIVGHTSRRSGAHAVAPLSSNEYQYNNQVARLIKSYAGEKGLEAEIFLRDQVGIPGAYEKASEWEPDAICELHFNAANGRARGTEILYSDVRDQMGIHEKEFAEIMQKDLCALFNRQGSQDRGIKNRTGRSGERGFTNLSQNFSVPSILLEPFFGDNPDDAKLGLQLQGEYAKAVVEAFIKWKSYCNEIYVNS